MDQSLIGFVFFLSKTKNHDTRCVSAQCHFLPEIGTQNLQHRINNRHALLRMFIQII